MTPSEKKAAARGTTKVRKAPEPPPAAALAVDDPQPIDVPDESSVDDAPDAEDVYQVDVTDDMITIHLKHPFKPLAGLKPEKDPLHGIGVCKLRMPVASDMLALDQEGAIAQIHALAIQLSGWPKSAFDRMHYMDFAAIHGVLNNYLGKFARASFEISASQWGS